MQILLLLQSLACSQDEGPNAVLDATNPQPQAVQTEAPPPPKGPVPQAGTAQAASTANELPDMSQGLSREGCDNGPGGPGAASYFYDELRISEDGTVTGTERWMFFANQKWKATEGKDCEVRWMLSGSAGKAKSCGSCDLGLQLVNNMDKVGSNCPENVAKGNTGEQIGYDIQRRPDGTATAYFSGSGKKFAEGYHKDGKLVLLSDMSCRWF
jgi:hypothetical protein